MKFAMYTFLSFAALGALATVGSADEQADRIGLAGSWVQSGGNHGWVIENSGDTVHMKQIEGSAPVSDFSCTADGKDCNIKISGHKATVSMYYNGGALITLETKGGQIVKRRFSVTGNAMKVDVTPMSSNAATEELQFARGTPSARK